MRLDDLNAIVGAVAVSVVVVTVVVAFLSRRAVTRRMKALVVRLDPGVSDVDRRGGTERTLARLERAASAAMGQVSEAAAVAERLEQVVRLLPQGVVVCDESGQVVYEKPVAGGGAGTREAAAAAGAVVEELLALGVRGEHASREIELFGPPRRLLALTVRPLDDGWRTIGAVVVADDVSAAHQLAVARRDLVRHAARVLPAPATALGALAGALATEDDPSVVRRLAGRVQHQAAALGRVVEELLDLHGVDGATAEQHEPVPVHLVVAEAVERARPRARARDIRLEVTEAPRRLTVLGDRRQLATAVGHLVDNAVRHSPAGGAVQVFAATDGRMVDVVVRDAGAGMSTREQGRIFEPFYRGEDDPDGGAGATAAERPGLGLTIARQVAERHGGDVAIHSREGTGTTFTLRLPIAPGSVVVTAAEAG